MQRHRSVKEPGGGGGRVRNSARGDEAEDTAIAESFSGKAGGSQLISG